MSRLFCAFRLMKALLVPAIVAALGGPAFAQDISSGRLMQGDAHVVIGWQNLHKEQPSAANAYQNDWLNSILHGGAGAGWYWTDHAKTQIDFGAGTRARQYRYRQFNVDGLPAYESSYLDIRQTNVSVSQQYQFFR